TATYFPPSAAHRFRDTRGATSPCGVALGSGAPARPAVPAQCRIFVRPQLLCFQGRGSYDYPLPLGMRCKLHDIQALIDQPLVIVPQLDKVSFSRRELTIE